jgi:DNA-binding transcriptional LysR family regulator
LQDGPPPGIENFIRLVSFGDQTFGAIEKGRLDLLLNADDGYVPPRFERETIFEDGFACVAASGNYSRKLTLKQYFGATHIGVGILGGVQMIPDKLLAAIGAKRRCAIWVPYYSAAIRCLPETALLATVPARMAHFESHNPQLKVLRPRDVLGPFRYLMTWNPRMNTDAAHLWLRKAFRDAAKVLLAG